MTNAWLRREGADWLFAIRVQPRASRDEIAGVSGERLRIRITAPPTDGKANEHLRRWLADYLCVPRARVVIEQGLTSRDKRVRVQGVCDLPPSLLEIAGLSTVESSRATRVRR